MIIGQRGTGKTALINAIGRHAAAEHGAVVLRWTAGSRLLGDAVATGSATIGVPGVASATAERRQRSGPTPTAFGQLESLAQLAAKQRCTVVVVIDEAQSADVDEIRTVAAAMQELATRSVSLWPCLRPVCPTLAPGGSTPRRSSNQPFTQLDDWFQGVDGSVVVGEE